MHPHSLYIPIEPREVDRKTATELCDFIPSMEHQFNSFAIDLLQNRTPQNTQRCANTAQKSEGHLKKKTTSYPELHSKDWWRKKFTASSRSLGKKSCLTNFSVIASNFSEAQTNSKSNVQHPRWSLPLCRKAQADGSRVNFEKSRGKSSSQQRTLIQWRVSVISFSLLQHHHTFNVCLKLLCHVKSTHWQTFCLLRTYHLWTRALQVVYTMMSKQTHFLLCPFGLFITIQIECQRGLFARGAAMSPYFVSSTQRTGPSYDVVEPSPFDTGCQWLRQQNFSTWSAFSYPQPATSSSLWRLTLGSIFDNFTQSYPPKVGEFLT